MITPGAFLDLGEKPPAPNDGPAADTTYIGTHIADLRNLAAAITARPVGIIIDKEGVAWVAPTWVFQTPVESEDGSRFRLGYRPTNDAFEKLNDFVGMQSAEQVTVLLEPPFDGDRVRIFNH